MNWSDFQLNVFDANIKPGNLFVNAVAGSGKTTVIEACIRQSQSDRILAIAFGRDIKAELEKRLGSLPNVIIKTLNGFGNSCLPKGWRKLNEDKVENLFKFEVAPDRDTAYKARRAVTRLVALCKANMFWTPGLWQIEALVEAHGIAIHKSLKVAQIHEFVSSTITKDLLKLKVIDYDDQIALPLFHDFEIPTFDRVYTDEAQDLTPAQIELTRRAVGIKAAYVGDPRQAIYQFRGADSQAVPNIIRTMSCQELPLSVCYRCAKAIVAEAQKGVSHILPWEGSPEGIVDRDFDITRMVKEAKDGDIALCRTTAPLVKQCLHFISNGRRAIVKGREIGQGLIELLDAAGLDEGDDQTKLDDYYHEKAEAFKGAALMQLQDSYETVCALFQKCRTAGDVKHLISNIFGETTGGVTFMTIHKAKGLENERVFFMHPELIPHKFATSDEQQLAEENLRYVGITRAKKELIYAS